MKIVTAICTHERPGSLARMLASLTAAAAPRRADWQVLVVDNPGSRQVQEVAASFRGRLPIELLVEPSVGLAAARNAAVAASSCDYFIWTDDDVTVCKAWLRDYEAAFERHPEAAFFGGPILPRFEGRPPGWIIAALPHIYTAFAGRELSSKTVTLDRTSTRLPFGANMAIRAEEQYRFRYDLALGRRPGRHMMSGEETDVMARICQARGFGIWLPDAAVEHWIDPARQTIDYVRRYYAGIGLGQSRARLAAGAAARWADDLATLWGMIRSDATYLWGRMAGRPETWVKALKQSAKLSGQLAAQREWRAAHPPRLRG